jgi:hypothetical protein
MLESAVFCTMGKAKRGWHIAIFSPKGDSAIFYFPYKWTVYWFQTPRTLSVSRSAK